MSKSETHRYYVNHYEILYDDGTVEQVTSNNKTVITAPNGNITSVNIIFLILNLHQ